MKKVSAADYANYADGPPQWLWPFSASSACSFVGHTPKPSGNLVFGSFIQRKVNLLPTEEQASFFTRGSAYLLLLVLRGLSRLRQANRHPCRLTPLSLLFYPHGHQLIINVGDSAAVVRPEMDVPLDDCGRAIGTDMKIRQIECQKLVRATSHTFQVLSFVLHCSIGVRVREIIRFATVHGCDVTP